MGKAATKENFDAEVKHFTANAMSCCNPAGMNRTHDRRYLCSGTFFAALLAVFPAAGAIAAEQAGVSAAVRGEVQLTRLPEAVGRQIGSGEPIYLTDLIRSGPGSGMQILLLDETIFTIGPSSELTIDEFVYDPDTDSGRVTATVAKGVFRFVTGKVAANRPQDMKVKTPFGTIGIRGTIVAGEVTDTGADVILLGPGGETNTAERIGRIEVSNGRGTVTVTRPGFGTSLGSAGTEAPSAPAQVPPERISALTNAISRPAAQPATDQASNGSSGGNQQQGQQQDGEGEGQSSQQGQPVQQNPPQSGTTATASTAPRTGPAPSTAGPGPGGGISAGGGFAGQAQASGIVGLSTLQGAQTSLNSQNAATQQIVQQIHVADGVSSLADLNTIASGRFHYDQVVPLTSGGSYRIIAEIDFGERRAGGGTSRVVINSLYADIGNVTRSLDAESFDDVPGGLANFGHDGNGPDMVDCASGVNACTLDLKASLLNVGGAVAAQLKHSLSISDTSAPTQTDSGSGSAPRKPGGAN